MSSLRNSIPRRAHKERAQPEARKKFGLLEKHKDYVVRAKAFHKKEETLRKLREKAEFRNPDEFNFKMIKSKLQDGVHQPKDEVNKFTPEEQLLMRTQDSNYILQLLQTENKKIEKLKATLHLLDSAPLQHKHVYYAEDREEAKEITKQASKAEKPAAPNVIPPNVKRQVEASYKELEARKSRAKEYEKMYTEMLMQKELQKKGRKRKLREDEIVNPTNGPVYKWRADRKR